MSEKMTVYALGDSLTWGYPYGPEQSWLAFVEKAMSVTTVNYGLNGDTTEGMRQRLNNRADRLKAGSLLIITGGANDAFGLVTPKRVLENYQAIVEKAITFGCTPVVGHTCPINEEPFQTRLMDYRYMLLDYAASNQIESIDFFRALVERDGRTFLSGYEIDGCHPSLLGYKKMGEVAVETIKAIMGSLQQKNFYGC